jgi:hypothetical protein
MIRAFDFVSRSHPPFIMETLKSWRGDCERSRLVRRGGGPFYGAHLIDTFSWMAFPNYSTERTTTELPGGSESIST